MLSKQQLYSIASMLAVSNLETTTSKIKQLNLPEMEEGIKFATDINSYYKTRNGFIPKRVLALLNCQRQDAMQQTRKLAEQGE